jgi:hypothetical protein
MIVSEEGASHATNQPLPYRTNQRRAPATRSNCSTLYLAPPRCGTRAKIVLLAAEGLPNDERSPPGWAPLVRSSPNGANGSTSKAWPLFWSERDPGGLRLFPPEVLVAIKALACELPAMSGVPLARWHAPDLARTAVEQGIVASVSDTTIWRWLSADAIRPCQHRSCGSSLAIPTSQPKSRPGARPLSAALRLRSARPGRLHRLR